MKSMRPLVNVSLGLGLVSLLVAVAGPACNNPVRRQDANGSDGAQPGGGAGSMAAGSGGAGTGGGGGNAGGGGGNASSVDGTGGTGGAPVSPTASGKGLGPWTGHDDVPASQSPPGGLPPSRVPMLISLGFDDNGHADGFQWVLDEYAPLVNDAGKGHAGTYDGAPAHATFFITSTYAGVGAINDPAIMKKLWHTAFMTGHELGDHTVSHLDGTSFTQDQWRTEIQGCLDTLTKPFDPTEMAWANDQTKGVGIPRDQIFGFRTPFLDYNPDVYPVLQALKFYYDATQEEGYEDGQNGTNFMWPYTLDHGSPGNDAVVAWNDGMHKAIGNHPGLWELPIHVTIVPPPDMAAAYGIAPETRTKLKALKDYFDTSSGFITGLDWNLWYEYGLTKAEFVAVMKYTLDLRLKGNRAPLTFGVHSDIYSLMGDTAPGASAMDRRAALDEFIKYALSKPEVRLVTMKQTLDWLRNPTPLD